MGFDRGLHIQHAVDRRLIGARQIGHHHLGGAAITTEDRVAADLVANLDQFAHFNEPRAVCRLCNRHCREPPGPGAR